MQNKIHLPRGFSLRITVNVIIALVCMAVYMAAMCRGANPVDTGLLIMAFYICAAMLVWIIFRRFFSGLTAAEKESDILGGGGLELLERIKQPSAIFGTDGGTVWHNSALSSVCTGSRYLRHFEDIFGVPLGDVPHDGTEHDLSAFGGSYGLSCYRFSSHNVDYFFVICTDKTELSAAYRRLDDENMIVAYIMADNLEELMQYVRDRYRAASSEVETVLKEWADSVNGILMEYDRDRYIFLFDAMSLDRFVGERFDVLDRVRDIRIGDGGLSITLSMGVSGRTGNFAEKDSAARAALDMALQRGGDQVAVRTDGGLDFYGGRSKGVQKRAKVRARVTANELAMYISKSSGVIIMAHRNMDFDAFGACIGLARLSMFCGVDVHIVAKKDDANLAKCFERILKLEEYRNVFISPSEALDMMGSETLLIIADVNNRRQYESAELFDSAFNTIIIDHHRKTEEFKVQPLISYIEPTASSACELVAEILEQAIPADQLHYEEAELMYSGILLDTKQFSRNTGERTFSSALYLRSQGADPVKTQSLFRTDMDDFLRESRFMNNLTIYSDYFAIAYNDEGGNTSADRIAAAKAADRLLSIERVQASFVLCRIDEDIVISARSAGNLNVQLIMERLGGGGHFDAAAAQLSGVTMNEALARLHEDIDGYMEELDRES